MDEIAYRVTIGGKSREKTKDPNTTFKSWHLPQANSCFFEVPVMLQAGDQRFNNGPLEEHSRSKP